MCGIVGYIGSEEAANFLVEGLRRLEYRGYDSSGVAVLNGGDIQLRRSVGKLSALEGLLKQQPVHGSLGLGHTRWATHGRPSEENAHPHVCCKDKIVVVHNGIIENYVALKRELMDNGHRFKSQTDTEVLAHLIEDAFDGDLMRAVQAALKRAQGSYALGVMSADDRERFIAVRKDSPLVLGIGKEGTYIASDIPALLPYTRKVVYLEDGDIAELKRDQVKVFDLHGRSVVRKPKDIDWSAAMSEKAGFKHYMLKEIYEQRLSIADTFKRHVSMENARIDLEDILPSKIAKAIPKVCLVGCGTSYHAALVARHWFEELAQIPCDVEIASEDRYRRFAKADNTLVVAVTQSGETADTLADLKESKVQHLPTMVVCNAPGSSATREADYSLFTDCGPEIGVASTKAFTGQLTALLVLALYIGQSRGTLNRSTRWKILQALSHLPTVINQYLESTKDVEAVAKNIQHATSALFLGRHLNYPIALEGALKLKETSYMHAEGYPAGEMKHGPIALIERELPVIAIATSSAVREKMLSNIEEVRARGGKVISVATEGDDEIREKSDFTLMVPAVNEYIAPILNVIPLQLLAYFVAVQRGCDVDQPRNLAKSVTVE